MCLDQRKRHPIFVKLCSSSSSLISENSFSDQDSLAGLNYTLYENEGKTILASDKINLLQGKKMRFMDRHESPLSRIFVMDSLDPPPSDFETFFVNRKILSILYYCKANVFTRLFCEKRYIHLWIKCCVVYTFIVCLGKKAYLFSQNLWLFHSFCFMRLLFQQIRICV